MAERARRATMDAMAVRADCRHYSIRTLATGDQVERCRLGAATTVPFACPDDCVFYEKRSISSAGWRVAGRDEDDDEPDR